MHSDDYFSYFNKRLNEVCKINDRLFKKILLVAMLDTLARVPSPNENFNKKRFVGFIDKFADWREKKLISLPQLSLLLETTTCSKLKDVVNNRLQGWQDGKVIYLLDDLECGEMLSFASNEEVDLIKQARHSNLLYVYRNNLVHEFREPAYGMEYNDDDQPFYFSLTNSESITAWELVYPVKFFEKIVRSSITQLQLYTEDNSIDPHTSYKFGSIWGSKL